MLINALELGNEEINVSNNQLPKKKEAQLKKGNVNEQSVKKRDGNYVSNIAKEALERGGGKASSATHGGGCRHYGILDLCSMERNYFLYYSKEGGWLNKKSCVSCGICVTKMKLDKGTKSLLRYCEMGLKSAKINRDGEKEDKEFFDDHNCSMVLCVPCWNNKVAIHDSTVIDKQGNLSRRCSSRKK